MQGTGYQIVEVLERSQRRNPVNRSEVREPRGLFFRLFAQRVEKEALIEFGKALVDSSGRAFEIEGDRNGGGSAKLFRQVAPLFAEHLQQHIAAQ